MTNDERKRVISFVVFGLGIVGGIWGWVRYLGAMFVVGENDCSQEVWAIIFALATPLPACVIALWQRLAVGSWLLFAGLFFPYGMVIERSYMIHARHFTDQPTTLQTVEDGLVVALPLLTIGLFFIVTGLLKWPRLVGGPQSVVSS